ncbi:MAG: inositol monophosphatase [Myxococcales bacterium]|nr:inositol monophosphatase [Myxococcales bacterium]
MNQDELQKALPHVKAIALEAGQLLDQGYRKRPDITLKGAIDLVTEYDLRVEQLVQKRLHSLFPHHNIIGEELPQLSGDQDLTWYIDPLDGTTNFSHGHPFFSVSIGLCHNRTPLLGVVHAPILGTTWTGIAGIGAHRNGVACQPSVTKTLNQALCATGFPYDRKTNPDNNLHETSILLLNIRGLRRCGSASIDLCMVADGTYDLYWEGGVKPWDIAAGMALVAAAGGRLTAYDGSPIHVETPRLVASNGIVHKEAISLLLSRS